MRLGTDTEAVLSTLIITALVVILALWKVGDIIVWLVTHINISFK